MQPQIVDRAIFEQPNVNTSSVGKQGATIGVFSMRLLDSLLARLSIDVEGDEDLAAKIRAYQIDSVAKVTPLMMAANVINAGIIVAYIYPQSGSVFLLCWGALIASFAAYSLFHRHRYRRRFPVVRASRRGIGRVIRNALILGAAWGLLAKASDAVRVPFFLFVSLAAMIFIVAFLRKLEEEQLLLMVSLALVFGGALGNFIDRLHLAYVIDFIDWYVGTKHWPTFNFADAAITTGVGFMILEWIRDALRARQRAGV